MKKTITIISLVALLCLFLVVFTSCSDTSADGTSTPTSAPTQTTPTPVPPVSTTPTPEATKTSEDEPYVFPEDGVLKLLEDGSAPYSPDGKNPSLVGDKILIFFDFTYKKAGLDLAEDTQVTFKIIKNGETKEGTAALDNSVADIKNQYGYVGVCFDAGVTFDKFEKADFSISFCDKSGKEYFVNNKQVYKGLSYLGLDAAAFDEKLSDDITTTVAKQYIKQQGTINGTDFSLTIYLSKWKGKTNVKQIITCSQVFWQVYPRMYARFSGVGQSPTDVTLTIEYRTEGVAHASGSDVNLNDSWLQQNFNDYDCLTHEFAHVIQNGWDGEYCEYSDYIERFADYCRFVYAYNDGKFNDKNWTLHTVDGENTRESSVRFLVWLDYFYSTEDNDLLLKYFTACRGKKYPAAKWSSAWQYIFAGSDLEGKGIEEVWAMYEQSEFAKLSAKSILQDSPLTKKYDVREKLNKPV